MQPILYCLIVGLTSQVAAAGEQMDAYLAKQTQQAKALFSQSQDATVTPKVKLAHKVIWSDRSLGCPSPEISYNQVLTDGVQIVLTSQGKDYYYHGDNKGRLKHCDNTKMKKPYRMGWQAQTY